MPIVFSPWVVILVPAIIFSIWAQMRVSGAFRKYSKVRSGQGLTGAQAARHLLDRAGLQEVRIEGIPGKMTDHYDPRDRTLRLSPDVANSTSLAALGIAAHEAGHALQDKDGYAPMKMRLGLVPVVNFGSSLMWPLVFGGFFFQIPVLISIGIVLYSAAVLFHVVTLPVEYNASSRALAELRNTGLLRDDEISGARRVLSAAALTYVAAMLTAILHLVYLVALSRD
ncbi:zinc metallopeptidase [bacterium]|nr:zinc metallopeptidase [bacterium]